MFRPFPPQEGKGKGRDLRMRACVKRFQVFTFESNITSHLYLGTKKDRQRDRISTIFIGVRQAGRQGKQTKQASRHPQSLISSHLII